MKIDKVKELKKVELHRHLDCSWRYSTLVELALEAGIVKSTNPDAVDEALLVTKPLKDLNTVLLKFQNSQKLLSSEKILERLAFEVTEDAFNDGIVLIELRYSLNFIQEASQLSYEKIHAALVNGIARAKSKYPISVGLISILQRGLSNQINSQVLDFTLNEASTFIGIDLADQEDQFNPKDFKHFFDKAYNIGLPITIHCGETPDIASAHRVTKAITDLNAVRIGHGIHSINDPSVVDLLIKKGVHLEICPISNYLTNAYRNRTSHPIFDLYKTGVSLSINTDDPGIFKTRLSDDYQFLIQNFPFQESDFKRINQMALQASFISDTEKSKIKRTLL